MEDVVQFLKDGINEELAAKEEEGEIEPISQEEINEEVKEIKEEKKLHGRKKSYKDK